MAGLAHQIPSQPKGSGQFTRVMLVDDSMVARAVLSRMIEMSPDFEVVGVAGTAEDALIALRETDVPVDIVMLDLEMPGMGGLKSLPEILQAADGAQVLVVSSLAEEGAEVTVKALAMGAADTLPKPGTGRFHGRFSDVLLERLRALAPETRTQPVAPFRKTASTAPANRDMPESELGLLAIGSSTGGIHALASFFETLDGPIGAPILVTQHLPAAFMTVFARQLSMASGLPACVAEDNMPLKSDHIYVAPGDHHLTVKGRKGGLYVKLVEGRHISGCLPSVDPMFESAAEALEDKALGVVLTGMGRDGLEGARTMVAKGGAVIAQDEDSCAVWGMPRAVAEAGLACATLPPADIARLVVERARGK